MKPSGRCVLIAACVTEANVNATGVSKVDSIGLGSNSGVSTVPYLVFQEAVRVILTGHEITGGRVNGLAKELLRETRTTYNRRWATVGFCLGIPFGAFIGICLF
jgi:hypothetical protein